MRLVGLCIMKDKLTKRKRVKIDYKNLIKEEGLWSTYKKYRKRVKDTASERKIQYRFCRIWMNDRLNEINRFQSGLDDEIKIGSFNAWEDE